MTENTHSAQPPEQSERDKILKWLFSLNYTGTFTSWCPVVHDTNSATMLADAIIDRELELNKRIENYEEAIHAIEFLFSQEDWQIAFRKVPTQTQEQIDACHATHPGDPPMYRLQVFIGEEDCQAVECRDMTDVIIQAVGFARAKLAEGDET